MLWPEWWSWELELSSHLLKRMADRSFTEVDLRAMLERATGWRPGGTEGRFEVETRHRGLPWRVVVEPDEHDRVLVVVTCYPVEAS
jgi:hypothetical protein